MNDCGCNKKSYNFSMGCCQPVLGPIEAYYTKYQVDQMLEEIESAITSGCCITPEEVDEKISVATDDMATEEWVINQDYITGVDLSDYVTFEDLPSLSGYATQQWVINQNYAFNSEMIQYITNLQNQIDSLKEQISGCCGSTGETITRWITMTGENDYTCSGTTKYTKEKEQQSNDGGNTWADTGNYRSGSTVLEVNSEDCGYIPPIEPQYRWKAAPTSDYLCSGTSKYYKVYYEVSTDGGQTWQHVQPEQTKRGNLIEANSPDCGYVPALKFDGKLQNGGEVKVDCNSSSVLSKNEVYTSNYYTALTIGDCVSSIEEKAFLNSSNMVINLDIPGNVKTIGRMAFANSGISALTLHEGVKILGDGAFKACTRLSTVIIPNSVTQLVGDTFYVNNIKTLVIGSGVTSIGAMCFQRSSSVTGSTITIFATTPPTIVNNSRIFDGWGNAPIYVPAGSVNAYKAASGWSQYASRIQAIP